MSIGALLMMDGNIIKESNLLCGVCLVYSHANVYVVIRQMFDSHTATT